MMPRQGHSAEQQWHQMFTHGLSFYMPKSSALGRTAQFFVKCTGVLIDYNYVVVAAHCVHWSPLQTQICLGDDPGFQLVVKNQLKVFYGSNDITRANVVAVSKISVPSFFDYDKPEPRENDIAVIKLQHRLTIDRDFVVPICLLNNPTFLQGQTVTAVGRALADPTSFFGMSGDDLNHLNEIQTEVVSNSYCQRLYSDLRMSYNKSSMICGGVSKKGVLKGDCGGPLQVEKNGVYYLIGLTITSFSAVEYRDIMPDAFTKVSQHCPFIAAHTQNKVHCLTNEYSVEELQNCTKFYDKILFEKYQKTCLFTDFVDGSTKNLCRYP
ncbi:hypothetical protein niasHT_013696 [Heterodera trifolii]|uniref:Peptidase S1 domain-containing protein n=1 Tax=Heterodera trifolii TaxID=157864 RepID=A0ABD2LD82_9BILA